MSGDQGEPRRPGGPFAALRRLQGRTPLRVKLTVALLLLVAVALGLMSVASSAALRRSLVGRLDGQLHATAAGAVHDLAEGHALGPPPNGPDTDHARVPEAFLAQVRDANGRIVDKNDEQLRTGQQPPQIPADPRVLAARAGSPFTVHATSGRGSWRVLVEPVGGKSVNTAIISASLDDIAATISGLQRIELLVSLGLLLVLAVVAVATVRASLRPLVDIEQTAEAIAAGDLSRRVRVVHPRTEVGRLGRALNGMLAQIEGAFSDRAASEAAARNSEERMRRFVTDASHELRTPLTTIRGFAELYRQGAAPEPADLDRLMRRIEGQAARMGLLVDDLLLLARLDQQRPLERRPVDLLALAADAVSDARVVAPDRRIELTVGDSGEASSWALIVLGDDSRLRQVLTNLLGNALTHTPAGTPVEVRAGVRAQDGGRARVALEVVDHGQGLSAEQAQHVFDRFYRADSARSHTGGAGLGLSIVAGLVAAHEGSVEVDSAPGQGATFRVLLPLAPASQGSVPERPAAVAS